MEQSVTPAPAEIPLHDKRGCVVGRALVDAADAVLVSQWRWRLQKGYARGYRDGRDIFMHRLVLGGTVAGQVDHINRDRLDNRKANLRVCSAAENSQNLSPRAVCPERGVSWDARDGQWVARVQRHRGAAPFRKRFNNLSDAVMAVRQARAGLMPFSREAACQ